MILGPCYTNLLTPKRSRSCPHIRCYKVTHHNQSIIIFAEMGTESAMTGSDLTCLEKTINFSEIPTTSQLFQELRKIITDYQNTTPAQRETAQNLIYVLFITKLTQGQRKLLECYISEMIDGSQSSYFDQYQEEMIFWGQFPIIRNLSQVKEFIRFIDDIINVRMFEFIKELDLVDDLDEFEYQLGLGKRQRTIEENYTTFVKRSKA